MPKSPEIEKEEKIDYSFDVVNKAQKLRSTTLLKQSEEIKKTLSDKNASMQDLITNGGFLSSIRIAFKKWSLARYQQEAQVKLSKIEADLKIAREVEEKQKERAKNLAEFNEELKDSDKLKEEQAKNSSTNGDLEYHTYTGKGIKAKQNSEIMALLDNEKELKGFKLEVYNQVMSELNDREAELNNLISDNDKILANVEESNRLKYKGPVNAFDKEGLLEAVRIKNEIPKLQDAIAKKEGLDKSDKDRLAKIPKEREAAKKKLQKIEKGYDYKEEQKSIEEGEALSKAQAKVVSNLEAQYFPLRDTREAGGILTAAEILEMDRLSKEYKKEKETADKLEALLDEKRERRDNYLADKEEQEEVLSSLEKEEKGLKDDLLQRETEYQDNKIKLGEFTERDKINQKAIAGYDDLMKYAATDKGLKDQLDQVKYSKGHLKNEVLHTDISSVMLDNFTNDKVQGMAIAGKIYLNKKQVEELDLSGPPKINEEEKNRVIQTQKIVRALKSRSIFRVLNSNTISEYMTYNEEKGDFELHNENNSQSFEDYEAKIRNKYFPDDNIFHQHLVEKAPHTYAWNKTKAYVKDSFKNALYGLLKYIKEDAAYDAVSKLGDEEKQAVGTVKAVKGQVDDIVQFVVEDSEGLDKTGTIFEAAKLAEDTMSTCLSEIEKYVEVGEFTHPLADTLADMSFIKGLEAMGATRITGFDIAQHVIDMGKAATQLAQSAINEKNQRQAAAEMLKRGHERFARVMKEAVAKSKFDKTEAIIDLTSQIAKDGFMITTGLAGSAVQTGVDYLTKAAHGIHKYVANKKNDKELLNSPDILGNIDYDKNVITDKDFNALLESVTGIENKEKLADDLRIIDAIDTHRAAKNLKDKPNAEVTKALKNLNLANAHTFSKLKVDDILQKTSIRTGNFMTRLRDSIEKTGAHYMGAVARWFKALFRKTAVKGKLNNTREEIAHKKQEEIVKKSNTPEMLQKKEGAKLLYERYVNRLKEQSKTMPLAQIKSIRAKEAIFNSQLNRENTTMLLSATPEAQKAFEYKNNPLSDKKIDDLLDSAIDHANDVLEKSIEFGAKNKQPEKKQEQKTADKGYALV